MKPQRPLWITLATLAGFLILTAVSWSLYGAFALIPLAFAMAFLYDLSHHSSRRGVIIMTRVFAVLGLDCG